MNHTNFISASRLSARNQRRRVRRWIGICSIYSLVLVTGSALAQFTIDTPTIRPGEVAKVADEISHAKTMAASLRLAALRDNAQMQTIHVISQQPDWSLLMNAVAGCRGTDVFFTNCELRPAVSATGNPGGGYLLRLGGVGQSEEGIAAFVVRLNALPILGHVNLGQSTRLEAFGGDAFAFQLECTIRNSPGGTDAR